MISSLHSGVSALKSLSQGLQVLGNNIANVNSLGYKSTRANYSDNFYLNLNDAESGANGVSNNNLQQNGTGVHVGSVSSDFNQGTIETTGLDLDLAIQGEALPNGGGFFEVVDPVTDEVFYTRAGAFEENAQGLVVTRDQYRYQLQGVDGLINLTLDGNETLLSRRVEEDGRVNLVLNSTNANGVSEDLIRNAGQIKLVNFQSPQYLRRVGNGFFTNGAPGQNLAGLVDNFIPANGSNGKIKQYSLELSNVDLTNEFASMISHQRSFQAGSRVVTTSDAILQEAINLKR
ncbi:MAG: flagellar hook-basal body complex protein [Verrucomicrobiota bacterium]|nr:flagellar hook-basal body complex protein [Verrucomicrobiota bacterium]|tara:strand:+ start:172 stop:1038 length:867 start_codon:yes stop_codon:yes gene_type:complete